MTQNNNFINVNQLESGLYTGEITKIFPRRGTNLLDFTIEILVAPQTRSQRTYAETQFTTTINAADESFQETFRKFAWRKRTTHLHQMQGLYVDFFVEPKVERGVGKNTLVKFSYCEDLNLMDGDRLDDEQ